MYGIKVNRNGMAVCPFHNDKNPSMKVDKRFHCFACQADGDAVDFVSRLFGLPCKEAAMKLADDFGIGYDSRHKPTVRPKIREPTAEQLYQKEEARCFRVLSDYCALPGFVDSKNEEKTERNAGYLVVSHSGGGMLRQGTRKGIRRTPANRGMRAHWVVKGLDISEDVCHGMCP